MCYSICAAQLFWNHHHIYLFIILEYHRAMSNEYNIIWTVSFIKTSVKVIFYITVQNKRIEMKYLGQVVWT